MMRLAMAALYAVAGFLHLATPAPFLAIIPNWVPAPHAIIALTGLCEIAGAWALLSQRLRWWAAIMLALYAVCVFPANIKHALEHVAIGGVTASWWYHGPRLAFQPVLVWWALFAGGVIDWPLRGK
jgi:uncharacterized membrane protein